ncbi:hypothetical protein [Zavarzinella formosa]|uniref:hypothetical protein n=1 Tax=Zavarzinella formosa TaxID=360055 RepID=UPI0012F83892|nr:hypothetical protein [Zavarzinella formosa]
MEFIAFSIKAKADNRKSSNFPPSIGSRASPVARFLSQTHLLSVIARFILINISQNDRLGGLNISEKENEKLRMNREGFAEKKRDIFQLVKTDETDYADDAATVRWQIRFNFADDFLRHRMQFDYSHR